MMLAGRALQGFGAASPRIVSIAMVRDGQGGAAMARIMSFVMSVFMLVPILAPSIGQLVLFVASWRMIFVGFLGMALDRRHLACAPPGGNPAEGKARGLLGRQSVPLGQ